MPEPDATDANLLIRLNQILDHLEAARKEAQGFSFKLTEHIHEAVREAHGQMGRISARQVRYLYKKGQEK